MSPINLLSEITIRSVTMRNRIVVSPMCQYSATDGYLDDWHLVHLGSRAVGGAGLIFVEATAVTAEGRITAGDLGLWKDEQIDSYARVASFLHRMGAVAGIQLAHAGRKASCLPPWEGRSRYVKPEDGGWKALAPSPIPFTDGDPLPQELDLAGMQTTIESFVSAAKRAVTAGFKIIEIHSAHGYLLHSFLSELSNHRTDQYGGSFENRIRLLTEVVTAVRGVISKDMPLFVRISASDWADGGWDIDQSVELAKVLRTLGVDLIDTSSGGLVSHAKIPLTPGYQVPFARRIRKDAGIKTGAVGLITTPEQGNEIITSESADLVFFAREMLREPYFALHAEKSMGQEPNYPLPYGYAV